MDHYSELHQQHHLVTVVYPLAVRGNSAEEKMTPVQQRALEIIRDHPGITPRAFGRLLWSDAEAWQYCHKCGNNGSSTGGGMNLASGAYLGKLAKAGLVYRDFGSYGQTKAYLTKEGREALEKDS
jgi:hypothetical protein